MKKACLLILIQATAFLDLFAAPIRSFPELTSAMHTGNRFVMLLDLQQCTGKAGMPTGYITPTAMMLVPETGTTPERVVTSHFHFTDRSGKPTYEYVKFTLYSDNTVIVQTTFYEPQSFAQIGLPHTFNCLIGKGIEIYSE
ncbi:MAG: hypothetical protein H0T62_03455 [Parachlamydiaceae bacterium]|nr:hypothetical protein [Parachlamydiaceae bacterium]